MDVKEMKTIRKTINIRKEKRSLTGKVTLIRQLELN